MFSGNIVDQLFFNHWQSSVCASRPEAFSRSGIHLLLILVFIPHKKTGCRKTWLMAYLLWSLFQGSFMISDPILVWVVIKLISDFFRKVWILPKLAAPGFFLVSINTGSFHNKITYRRYFGTPCCLVISQVSQSDDNAMATVWHLNMCRTWLRDRYQNVARTLEARKGVIF